MILTKRGVILLAECARKSSSLRRPGVRHGTSTFLGVGDKVGHSALLRPDVLRSDPETGPEQEGGERP